MEGILNRPNDREIALHLGIADRIRSYIEWIRGVMEKLVQWVFIGSLGLLPISCWQRDDFVSELNILPELAVEPAQQSVSQDPFSVRLNDVDYRVEPQYDYDLHGLVVSYQHHDGDQMLHRLWNDHLNIADVCVVWGRNATALNLKAFEFWNGQFTCFFRTGDDIAWRQFDKTGISNNHLITEDGYLRDLIDEIQIGDQIRLQGWLANYSNGDGFHRGTSTTRTDEGNGACETIYVTRFDILSTMANGWRSVFVAAMLAMLGSGMFWLIAVMRGGFRHRSED
jgi:hypothetical protein